MPKDQRTSEPKEEQALVNKGWVFSNNDGTSSLFYHESTYLPKEALPEIEAKAEGKNVLIRVHCENQNGFVTKVVGEIEKLHLSVENISSLPFGEYFLDITITALMCDEFGMTMKDLKINLRQALL